jgi:integrase/recombinase XerD
VGSINRLAHWDAMMAAYLTNRRSLGRAYLKEEQMLRSVRKYLAAVRADDLNQEAFDRWRNTFRHLNPNTRLARERAVYNFCRYRRRSEPHCFLPDPLSFARGRAHPLPTLIEPSQVARMLTLASSLEPGPRSPLRPVVMRLAIVLLYTAGLRRREVVRLTLEDVDPKSGVLWIRESKFHKSRWVVLSRSACMELRRFLAARQSSGLDSRPSAPLLCNARGKNARCYSGGGLAAGLGRLFDAAGVRNSKGGRPRIQDYRHSFAYAALSRWYESGADVQASLPKLALFMGHVSIVSTAYYLRWIPAVVAHASGRFERSCANVLVGDEL